MLYVHDRDGGEWEVGAPAASVRLGRPHGPLPPFDRIVCDVRLDDLASVDALRLVLARHRPSAAMPLHVVLREDTIFAHAIANALGATTIARAAEAAGRYLVSCAAASRVPTAAPLAASSEAGLGGEASELATDYDPEAAIGDLARSFGRIFAAAAGRRAIEEIDLDRGVDLLLRSVRRSKIGRWVEVVRRYDDATYQHCLLVAGLTAAFAMKLGLSPQTQRMLAQAAILHDVGKARVPLAVLNKAGALSPSEQTAMRRHPVDGYYMLDRQPGLLPGVRDVVRHHHELLDGSGYPEGLKKAQIAEPVRIVTICDVRAALIERRPYRASLSSEAAYAIMVSMGGKLDAGLLEAFESVIAPAGGESPARVA